MLRLLSGATISTGVVGPIAGMRRRPIKGKKSIEQELVARKATVPCRHTTSIDRSINRSVSQSVSQSWSETRCGLHYSECSCIAKHIEAKRSMVLMVITPLPLSPFPFPFPFPFPLSREGGSSLLFIHHHLHQQRTNNMEEKQASKAKASVKNGSVVLIITHFVFFPAWGGIIM